MPLPNHCLMCDKPVQGDDLFCSKCDKDDEDRTFGMEQDLLLDLDLDVDVGLDLEL